MISGTHCAPGLRLRWGRTQRERLLLGELELGRRKERRDLLKIYVYFCYDKAAGMYKCKGEIIIVVMQAELCFLINGA